MGRFVRLFGCIAGVACGLHLAGCVSRTLPLPPPDIDPLGAPSVEGLVLVKGTAQEGAAVGIMNDSTMNGVIVTSPGKGCDRSCPFSANIAARSGDTLHIWQFYETNSSVDPKVPR